MKTGRNMNVLQSFHLFSSRIGNSTVGTIGPKIEITVILNLPFHFANLSDFWVAFQHCCVNKGSQEQKSKAKGLEIKCKTNFKRLKPPLLVDSPQIWYAYSLTFPNNLPCTVFWQLSTVVPILASLCWSETLPSSLLSKNKTTIFLFSFSFSLSYFSSRTIRRRPW